MQVVFREMADEHPDADAGDVVFVLKQQELCQWNRRVIAILQPANIGQLFSLQTSKHIRHILL